MKFVDEARLRIEAGDGGDGRVAFLHEKYRPLGGPAGGDGGRGGDILAYVDAGLSTLLDYTHRHTIKAERGQDGGIKSRHGPGGEDLVLRFPPGTLIFDEESGECVADLTIKHTAESPAVLGYGGIGGRGNARFATPTHQAPRRADPGTKGDKKNLRLELRLLADAGLLGLPNAGKSSLLARVSAARPKVADYPFTTLAPALGVVRFGEEAHFVLADIPGLIEGASEGHGLGTRFLRHVRRTALLIHLIDCSSGDLNEILAAHRTINAELTAYDEELGRRDQIVVLTKMDLPDAAEVAPDVQAALEELGLTVHAISAATGLGISALVNTIGLRTQARRKEAQADGQVETTENDDAEAT